MDLFVGLTGYPGAGKEAVAHTLMEAAAEYGIHTYHYSFSAPIKEENIRRGLQPFRENLHQTANEIRASLGNGAWAQFLVSLIQADLARDSYPNILVIIDGIRNPGEIDQLRRIWGSHFKLLAVEAPKWLREQNIASRSSFKDSLADRARDRNRASSDRESGASEPPHGLKVEVCMKQSDWEVNNSAYDPSLTTLQISVVSLFEQSILPFFRLESEPLSG